MKKIIISLSRAYIYEEIKEKASYAGGRHPVENEPAAEAAFRRVTISAHDLQLIERYWNEGASGLIERLKDYVEAADFSGDEFLLTLAVSSGYDESLTPSVKSALSSYMVSALAFRWYRITFPVLAGEYEAAASGFLTEAERQLCHRRPPKRPSRHIPDFEG